MANEYYESSEKYLEAIAHVMKDEYEAIHEAGFVLQLDCPDLAMSRHNRFPDTSLDEFRKIVALPRGGPERGHPEDPAGPDAAPPVLGELRGAPSP